MNYNIDKLTIRNGNYAYNVSIGYRNLSAYVKIMEPCEECKNAIINQIVEEFFVMADTIARTIFEFDSLPTRPIIYQEGRSGKWLILDKGVCNIVNVDNPEIRVKVFFSLIESMMMLEWWLPNIQGYLEN